MFFLKRDRSPIAVSVVDVTPERCVTRIFSVVADWGWAEGILCTGAYKNDANDIARCIGERLKIPVHLAE